MRSIALEKDVYHIGVFFVIINRARQYGKTTTLVALRKYLSDAYEVILLDFQGIGTEGFQTEQRFVKAFCRLLVEKKKSGLTFSHEVDKAFSDILERESREADLLELFSVITDWCRTAKKEIVLLVDEVDSASNNQVFLDYIARDIDDTPTFQSVILAGVTDIRFLSVGSASILILNLCRGKLRVWRKHGRVRELTRLSNCFCRRTIRCLVR